jgi:cyclase
VQLSQTLSQTLSEDSRILKHMKRLALMAACLVAMPLMAANEDPVVREQVSGNVWMLSGGGYANISVLAGDGEALMVDAKSAGVADQIRAHVREISGGGVRYLINGHEHPDHTDGNAGFGEDGSVIIAHEEVLSVLSAGQRGGPPAPRAALPVVTIPPAGELTLHFAGETVRLIAAPAAHSAGNIIVFYEEANVLHMGDLFGPDRFPVIAAGTIDGFIAADEMALALANDQTRVIAGIGALASVQQLRDYLAMLVTVRQRVADLVAQGKTEEEVMAAGVTREFESTWGDPSRFLPAVYRNLATP